MLFKKSIEDHFSLDHANVCTGMLAEIGGFSKYLCNPLHKLIIYFNFVKRKDNFVVKLL